MMDERFQSVDKAQLARRFGAAARHYDAHARFQQEVGLALLDRMTGEPVTPASLSTSSPISGLDLGCGTGFFLPHLASRCHQLHGLDLAPGMLQQAALRGSGAQLVCGDAERLPFADGSLDWVFSSLALQWCERPAQAFAELHRVLKPGGQLLFSTLLVDSLWQLREAWRTVDDHPHVNRFLSLPQLQDAVAAGGFTAPCLESLAWALSYHELSGLLRDLKGIGASQLNDARQSGLSSRLRLQRLTESYEAYRQPDGLLAASYQVCLGRLIRR
ncbi:malonyl-ACP O-methyltransferase BioC [Aeromonas salmonicida]|uniref:malonyl-ACP O-methyltransferase BioC n=1 Tax=Aeromonas salmonicida TaxID=645 RepID=UPI003D087BE6